MMGDFKLKLTLTPAEKPEELDGNVSPAMLHRLHSIEPVLFLFPWSSSLGRKPYARTPTTSHHSLATKSDHRATRLPYHCSHVVAKHLDMHNPGVTSQEAYRQWLHP